MPTSRKSTSDADSKPKRLTRASSAEKSPPPRKLPHPLSSIPEGKADRNNPSTPTKKVLEEVPSVGTPRRSSRASINPSATASPARVTRRSVAAIAEEVPAVSSPRRKSRASINPSVTNSPARVTRRSMAAALAEEELSRSPSKNKRKSTVPKVQSEQSSKSDPSSGSRNDENEPNDNIEKPSKSDNSKAVVSSEDDIAKSEASSKSDSIQDRSDLPADTQVATDESDILDAPSKTDEADSSKESEKADQSSKPRSHLEKRVSFKDQSDDTETPKDDKVEVSGTNPDNTKLDENVSTKIKTDNMEPPTKSSDNENSLTEKESKEDEPGNSSKLESDPEKSQPNQAVTKDKIEPSPILVNKEQQSRISTSPQVDSSNSTPPKCSLEKVSDSKIPTRSGTNSPATPKSVALEDCRTPTRSQRRSRPGTPTTPSADEVFNRHANCCSPAMRKQDLRRSSLGSPVRLSPRSSPVRGSPVRPQSRNSFRDSVNGSPKSPTSTSEVNVPLGKKSPSPGLPKSAASPSKTSSLQGKLANSTRKLEGTAETNSSLPEHSKHSLEDDEDSPMAPNKRIKRDSGEAESSSTDELKSDQPQHQPGISEESSSDNGSNLTKNGEADQAGIPDECFNISAEKLHVIEEELNEDDKDVTVIERKDIADANDKKSEETANISKESVNEKVVLAEEEEPKKLAKTADQITEAETADQITEADTTDQITEADAEEGTKDIESVSAIRENDQPPNEQSVSIEAHSEETTGVKVEKIEQVTNETNIKGEQVIPPTNEIEKEVIVPSSKEANESTIEAVHDSDQQSNSTVNTSSTQLADLGDGDQLLPKATEPENTETMVTEDTVQVMKTCETEIESTDAVVAEVPKQLPEVTQVNLVTTEEATTEECDLLLKATEDETESKEKMSENKSANAKTCETEIESTDAVVAEVSKQLPEVTQVNLVMTEEATTEECDLLLKATKDETESKEKMSENKSANATELADESEVMDESEGAKLTTEVTSDEGYSDDQLSENDLNATTVSEKLNCSNKESHLKDGEEKLTSICEEDCDDLGEICDGNVASSNECEEDVTKIERLDTEIKESQKEIIDEIPNKIAEVVDATIVGNVELDQDDQLSFASMKLALTPEPPLENDTVNSEDKSPVKDSPAKEELIADNVQDDETMIDPAPQEVVSATNLMDELHSADSDKEQASLGDEDEAEQEMKLVYNVHSASDGESEVEVEPVKASDFRDDVVEDEDKSDDYRVIYDDTEESDSYDSDADELLDVSHFILNVAEEKSSSRKKELPSPAINLDKSCFIIDDDSDLLIPQPIIERLPRKLDSSKDSETNRVQRGDTEEIKTSKGPNSAPEIREKKKKSPEVEKPVFEVSENNSSESCDNLKGKFASAAAARHVTEMKKSSNGGVSIKSHSHSKVNNALKGFASSAASGFVEEVIPQPPKKTAVPQAGNKVVSPAKSDSSFTSSDHEQENTGRPSKKSKKRRAVEAEANVLKEVKKHRKERHPKVESQSDDLMDALNFRVTLCNISAGTTLDQLKKAFIDNGIDVGLRSIGFCSRAAKGDKKLGVAVYDSKKNLQNALSSYGKIILNGKRLYFLLDDVDSASKPGATSTSPKKSPKKKFVGIINDLPKEVTMNDITSTFKEHGVKSISKVKIFSLKSRSGLCAKLEFTSKTALLKAVIASENMKMAGKRVHMKIKEKPLTN